MQAFLRSWRFACFASILLVGVGTEASAQTLAVTLQGAGDGHVSSTPTGIDCGIRPDGTAGNACEHLFAGGDVTLVANAADGSHFVIWSGECYGSGDTCLVSMDADETVTAWFERDSFGLVVVPSGDGSGTVTSDPPGIDCGDVCAASFSSAVSEVTLSVAPDAGSEFYGWTGDCVGTATTCVVPMGASRQVRPLLSRSISTLVVSRVFTGDAGGDVTDDLNGIACGDDCTEALPEGTVVTLSAWTYLSSGGPPNAVDFIWEGPCQVNAERQCVVSMDGPAVNVTLRVFEVPDGATTELVTVRFSGSGGGRFVSDPSGIDCRIECSATFRTGTALTLTAIPDADSSLSGLSGSGIPTLVPPNQLQYTLDGSVEASARFELREYPVSVTKQGAGTGTVTSTPPGIDCGPTCTGSFDIGTEVTITAVPDPDSEFERLSISGGGEVTGTGVVRFTVRGSRTVDVSFRPAMRTISVTKTGTGTGRVTSDPFGIDCGLNCENEFRKTTSLTLRAIPDPSSRFVRFTASGPLSFPSADEVQFTVEDGRTVTAEFERTRHALAVVRTGTGSGTVNSTPTGIACGSDCSEWFPIGSSITLTPIASPGSAFTGWGGACSGTGSCTVNMTSSKTVTANFTELYRLSVTRSGTGTGTVTSAPSGISCGADCDEYYLPGTTVNLSASPTPSSDFRGFTGGGCGGMGPCVVTLNGPTTVNAEFERVRNSLAVVKVGTGAGVVTSSPGGIACGSDCSEWYRIGATVSLTSIPGTGSEFASWGGACSGSGGCSVTLDSSKSVTANFTATAYRLDVSKTGGGSGNVYSSPSGISCGSDCWEYFDIGSTVTLNPVASTGSTFAGWGGACSGTGACNVTMSSAKNVTANFQPIYKVLSVGRTGNGSGTIWSSPGGISCGTDCSESYRYGTSVTLNVISSTGSEFTGWSGACSGTGSCTVSMTSARSVTANFVLSYRLLTVGKSGTGSGLVWSSPGGVSCGADCSESYPFGTTVTLSASPSPGSTFGGWTGACSGTGSCTVSMNATKFVGAVFNTQYLQLQVIKIGDGAAAGLVTSNPGGISCGSDCWQYYAYGSSVTLTASGSRPYRFFGWGGACAGVSGPTCTVSMTSAKTVFADFRYDP